MMNRKTANKSRGYFFMHRPVYIHEKRGSAFVIINSGNVDGC